VLHGGSGGTTTVPHSGAVYVEDSAGAQLLVIDPNAPARADVTMKEEKPVECGKQAGEDEEGVDVAELVEGATSHFELGADEDLPMNRLATPLSTDAKRFSAGALARMLRYVATYAAWNGMYRQAGCRPG